MARQLPRLTDIMERLRDMSDDEASEFIKTLPPITGGEHEEQDDENADDAEDDENEDDGKGSGKNGDPSGKKGESQPKGKLYTKEQLDDIVEKAVTDRLRRERRQKDRTDAKDKGEYETLYASLQKEVDEELKPRAERVEALETRIEELEGVVATQTEALLKDLPQDLKDLDLGEDEDPVKRLNWLITKVLPKAEKASKADESKGPKGGNPASPKPRGRQGEDQRKKIPAPVSRKRF